MVLEWNKSSAYPVRSGHRNSWAWEYSKLYIEVRDGGR